MGCKVNPCLVGMLFMKQHVQIRNILLRIRSRWELSSNCQQSTGWTMSIKYCFSFCTESLASNMNAVTWAGIQCMYLVSKSNFSLLLNSPKERIDSKLWHTYSTTVIAKIKGMPRGHYSTIYHATSQLIMRSDTHFSI